MLRHEDGARLVLMAFLILLPIASQAADSFRATDVTTRPEGRRIENDLAKSVAKNSGRIVRCIKLIDYVADMPVGHDSSFGAFCLISFDNIIQPSLLCDDWMVGKFTLIVNPKKYVTSLADIIRFVHDYCPPGG